MATYMNNNNIEKPESPNPDDVLSAITSFNDPSIIVGIFKELGWSYSFEIKEWLIMARQNANLAVKSKALIQLRILLREASETSGLIANVSSTIPNPQGGHTTFSAKRIADVLNPTKQIESTIKEAQNDKTEETTNESNRGSNRKQSQTERTQPENEIDTRHRDIQPGTDTRDAFPSLEGCPGATPNPERDSGLGGTEPPDGGEISGQRPRGGGATPDFKGCSEQLREQPEDILESTSSPISKEDNPCIKTQPPTGDRDLFPGISTPAEED